MYHYWNIVKMFLLFFYLSLVSAECQPNLIITDTDLYILSDQLTTYQKAEETCQSYGGNIAQISSQDERQFFEPHLKKFYIKDPLIEVDIYKSRISHVGVRRDVYKYRKSTHPGGNRNDYTNIPDYSLPPVGEFRSITLYNREFKDFNQTVYFCWVRQRDAINLGKCQNGGWSLNFQLIGGTSRSKNAITLFNLIVERFVFTSRLSFTTSLNQSDYVIRDYVNLPVLHSTDISVFTGARSDVGQSNWFWNNGTVITDTTYPTSDTSVCQQMTWPLTYDDGINLRAKECGIGESHYICQLSKFFFSPTLKEVTCDGTSLSLSWKAIPDITYTFLGVPASIQVKFSNDTTKSFNIQENQTTVVVGGFFQRTKYAIQIKIFFSECENFTLTSNATGATGYGVPDSVTNAYVIKSSSDVCAIAWNHNATDAHIVEYKITSTSNVTKDTITVKPTSTSDEEQDLEEFTTHNIDLSGHGYNNTVSFEIQAVSSCGKTSESLVVNGICVSPMQQATTEKPAGSGTGFSTSAIVGILVGVLAILILLVLVLFIRKRKSHQKTKAATSVPEIANQPTIYEKPFNVGQAIDDTYVQLNSLQDYENFQHNHTYETVMSNTYENVA